MTRDLARAHKLDPRKTTVAELLALVQIGHAFDGEGAYNKELMERVEGKVADKVHSVTGKMSVTELMNMVNEEQKYNE